MALFLKAGDRIAYGHYPRTADGQVMPIRWRVLKVVGGKALILSDSLLDVCSLEPEKTFDALPAQYRKKYPDSPLPAEVMKVRDWLNTIFYDAAFSPVNKSIILTTPVLYGPYGAQDTVFQDRIFLLSVDEAQEYLPDRSVSPTDYARSRGAKDGPCGWLLRDDDGSHIWRVLRDGSLSALHFSDAYDGPIALDGSFPYDFFGYGCSTLKDGRLERDVYLTYDEADYVDCVRPALYISLL